jgi:hypothetical protein
MIHIWDADARRILRINFNLNGAGSIPAGGPSLFALKLKSDLLLFSREE